MKDFRGIIYEYSLKEECPDYINNIYEGLLSGEYKNISDYCKLSEEGILDKSSGEVSVKLVPEKYGKGVQLTIGGDDYRFVSDKFSSGVLVSMIQDMISDGYNLDDIIIFLDEHSINYKSGELIEDTQVGAVRDGLKTQYVKPNEQDKENTIIWDGVSYIVDSREDGKIYLMDEANEIFSVDEAEYNKRLQASESNQENLS